MHELRLVGVHEDGRHVLLADPAGEQYRLPLDEALRAAALRDRPRLGQLQIEIDGGLRPAEVQTLIRRGLSAEEVASRAGWSLEKVHRYEGPVLAEREYIAGLARKVFVGAGADRAPLEERVQARLRDRGVERDHLAWDSARDEDGLWTVTATFPAGGRERAARWDFDHVGRGISPRNDEARWLTQDEAVGPIPAPHVATSSNRPSTVYDVEAEGGVGGAARRRTAGEPIDLMAAMREHSTRGRRRRPRPSHTPGEDDPRLDALPLAELAGDPDTAAPPPVARDTHPESAHLDGPDDAAPEDGTAHESAAPEESVQPSRAERQIERQLEDDREEHDRRTSVRAAVGQSAPTGRPGRRGGRPSVPSWDDVMFGTRSRGDGD